MKRLLIQGIGFFGILILTTYAGEVATNSDYIETAPDFRVMSYDQADVAFNEIVRLVVRTQEKKIGPKFAAELVDQLRQGKLADEKKVLVVCLLGELHPADANVVEILIDNIDLRPPYPPVGTTIGRWGQYPAKDALIKIGKPAVDPIIKRFSTEGNELRLHLMCEVLKAVEKRDLAINQVKEEISRESNPSRRANLESVVKELQK